MMNIANQCDVATTWFCLTSSPNLQEANPIIVWAIENIGFAGTMVIKIIVLALLGLIYLDRARWLIARIFFAVSIWNIGNYLVQMFFIIEIFIN